MASKPPLTAPDPASDLSLGRLGGYLGFRLRRIQNQFSRDFGEETRDWGLRAGMFSALELIAANPGLSQQMLSDEVGLDKSALVSVIDTLEQRGWVQRQRSSVDRRRYELAVTSEGQHTLDLIFVHLSRVEAAAMKVLSEEEREMVSSALDKVYHAYVRDHPTTR